MTPSFRILLAACALAGANLAHAGSVTLNDPNCDSFTLGGTAGAQTLTCVVSSPPVCTVQGASAGSVGTPDTLTAACSPAATSWAWTGGSCQGATNQSCAATSIGAGVVGYTVTGTNANGPGPQSPVFNVTWTVGAPPPPTGCIASLSPNPSPMVNGGGTATVSVSGCVGTAGLTYNWMKNGSFGFGTTATPAADQLPAGGSAGYTNSYQVKVCNGADQVTNCVLVPAAAPLSVNVPGTGGGGTIDLSACTALGYVGHGVDMVYPTVRNSTRILTTSVGNFGANDMIVARFVAPASESNGSTLIASEYSIYPAAYRLATLSTSPCVVATSGIPSGAVLKSVISQAPTFSMSLAGGLGVVKLTPGATYYVNYVNRDAYNSISNSCGSGNCAMYIDFNN